MFENWDTLTPIANWPVLSRFKPCLPLPILLLLADSSFSVTIDIYYSTWEQIGSGAGVKGVFTPANPDPPRQQINLFPVHSKHQTITQLKTISPFQTQHNNTFRPLTWSTANPNLISSSSRRSSTPSQMLPSTSFLELAKSVGAVASVVSVLKVCFFLLFFISPNFGFQSIDGFG